MCDLDPQCQGHRSNNVFSCKCISSQTVGHSNILTVHVHRSHDVVLRYWDTLHVTLTPRSSPNNIFSCKCIFKPVDIAISNFALICHMMKKVLGQCLGQLKWSFHSFYPAKPFSGRLSSISANSRPTDAHAHWQAVIPKWTPKKNKAEKNLKIYESSAKANDLLAYCLKN